MSNKINGLPENMHLRDSPELETWLRGYTRRYRKDHGSQIVVYESPSQGTIEIYTDPPTEVGILFEPETNGWRGTPYVREGATSADIEELRRWCGALEAELSVGPRKSKRGPRPRTRHEKIAAVEAWDNLDRDKYAITLEEWLDERFGHTGGTLNVAPSTFHGWRKLKKDS